MVQYVIIDDRLRSEESKLLTPESIVGEVEAPSRKQALRGYDTANHSAILRSQIQGKGDERLRKRLDTLH
jgi:hypothetical protein